MDPRKSLKSNTVESEKTTSSNNSDNQFPNLPSTSHSASTPNVPVVNQESEIVLPLYNILSEIPRELWPDREIWQYMTLPFSITLGLQNFSPFDLNLIRSLHLAKYMQLVRNSHQALINDRRRTPYTNNILQDYQFLREFIEARRILTAQSRGHAYIAEIEANSGIPLSNNYETQVSPYPFQRMNPSHVLSMPSTSAVNNEQLLMHYRKPKKTSNADSSYGMQRNSQATSMPSTSIVGNVQPQMCYQPSSPSPTNIPCTNYSLGMNYNPQILSMPSTSGVSRVSSQTRSKKPVNISGAGSSVSPHGSQMHSVPSTSGLNTVQSQMYYGNRIKTPATDPLVGMQHSSPVPCTPGINTSLSQICSASSLSMDYRLHTISMPSTSRTHGFQYQNYYSPVNTPNSNSSRSMEHSPPEFSRSGTSGVHKVQSRMDFGNHEMTTGSDYRISKENSSQALSMPSTSGLHKDQSQMGYKSPMKTPDATSTMNMEHTLPGLVRSMSDMNKMQSGYENPRILETDYSMDTPDSPEELTISQVDIQSQMPHKDYEKISSPDPLLDLNQGSEEVMPASSEVRDVLCVKHGTLYSSHLSTHQNQETPEDAVRVRGCERKAEDQPSTSTANIDTTFGDNDVTALVQQLAPYLLFCGNPAKECKSDGGENTVSERLNPEETRQPISKKSGKQSKRVRISDKVSFRDSSEVPEIKKMRYSICDKLKSRNRATSLRSNAVSSISKEKKSKQKEVWAIKDAIKPETGDPKITPIILKKISPSPGSSSANTLIRDETDPEPLDLSKKSDPAKVDISLEKTSSDEFVFRKPAPRRVLKKKRTRVSDKSTQKELPESPIGVSGKPNDVLQPKLRETHAHVPEKPAEVPVHVSECPVSVLPVKATDDMPETPTNVPEDPNHVPGSSTEMSYGAVDFLEYSTGVPETSDVTESLAQNDSSKASTGQSEVSHQLSMDRIRKAYNLHETLLEKLGGTIAMPERKQELDMFRREILLQLIKKQLEVENVDELRKVIMKHLGDGRNARSYLDIIDSVMKDK